MAVTNELEKGMAIKHNNDIFLVLDFQSFQKGRGSSNLRAKLKSLSTGKTIETNFAGDNKFEIVPVERHTYQYLYPDGDFYVFMHILNFEQINVEPSYITGLPFLKEGMECTIMLDVSSEKILGVELPMSVALEVTYTEPSVKGDTVNNVMKAATVETGATVKVPMFVNSGDKIKIKTDTGEYIERVK